MKLVAAMEMVMALAKEIEMAMAGARVKGNAVINLITDFTYRFLIT